MLDRTFACLIISCSFLLPAAQAEPLTVGSQVLTVQSGCGQLTLAAIAPNAIRVRCSDSPSQLPELVYTNNVQVNASIGSSAGSSWIRTDRISAVLDKGTGVIRFLDAHGDLLTEEMPDGRSWNRTAGSSANTGVAEERLRLMPGEHLYGTGQFQDGYLDIARLPRKLVQLNTQIALPFVISNRGYGVLWHQYGLTDLNHPKNQLVLSEAGVGQSVSVDVTTSAGTQRQTRQSKQFEGNFEVPENGDYALQLESGRTMTDRWYLAIDGKTIIDFSNFWLPGSTSTLAHLSAGHHHVIVYGNADDHPSLRWAMAKDETTFRSPDAPGIDYTVFAGSADEVIASYRTLSGNVPLFPKWAFGFIQCKERYRSSRELLDTVHEFRDKAIPLDVIVQDWQYWGKYGWNAMQFDERNYPDPAKLVDELHQDHAHLMVSVWSRFDPASEVGKEFQQENLFVPGTTWVDFLNPSAAQLYWKEFSARMLSLGIDAWWLDATEPENDDLHQRTTYDGPGDLFRLVYPLFVTKTVYEGSRKDAPDHRTMILTRSAFLGEQREAISTWSGDIGNNWDTLKRQITGGLDYVASGLPYWTTDTGGFFRPREDQYADKSYHERFLRWMAFSTFSPLLRVHGYQTNTEPWNYGPDVEEKERSFIDLRYKLLPYIYAQAAAVTFNGGTMMRPLVMDFPSDQKALNQKYEYMFGPSFLVAPVVDPGVTAARIYAPLAKGGWYDWWTERHVSSGKEVILKARLDEIPLLVKAGSIVPLSPVQQYVGQVPNPSLELKIFPGTDGAFTLYDDDGTTYGYERHQCSRIQIVWRDHAKTLTLEARQGSYPGMPLSRQFTIRLIGSAISTEHKINYDGRKIIVDM